MFGHNKDIHQALGVIGFCAAIIFLFVCPSKWPFSKLPLFALLFISVYWYLIPGHALIYGPFLFIGGFISLASLPFLLMGFSLPRRNQKTEYDSSKSLIEEKKIQKIRQWQPEQRSNQGYAVILMYNAEKIPSSDSGFPDINDDYLYGRCLPCVGETEKDLILQYKDRRISVFKEKSLQIVYPGFSIGQYIETVPPRTYRAGKVAYICWHFKYKAPMFFLDIGGKVFKSRYYGYELRLCQKKEVPDN